MNDENIKKKSLIQWMKNTFFPMSKEEAPRVLSLAIMFAGIVFMYTVVRQAKESLLMALCGGSSSVIPSAKVVVMIVAAILGVQHSKITRKYSHKKAFLVSFIPFLVFFGVFALVFDKADMIQMSDETIRNLSIQMPFLRYFFVIFGKWFITSYYVFAEMFGTFMLGVTFWQLVNFYSSHEQAKRIYPYFGLWAQLGNYFAGKVMINIGTILESTGNIHETVFFVTVSLMLGAIIVLGSLFFFFYHLKKNKIEHTQSGEKKAKVKVHWKDSFNHLKAKPALLLTAFLSVWYGICATSMEIFWKGKVVAYYGIGYTTFMGKYQTGIAIVSIIFSLAGGVLLRKLPWVFAASVTPILVIFSSSLLFGMNVSFVQNTIGSIFNIPQNILHTKILFWTVIVGAGSITFFKGSKYTLCDPAKEMVTRSRSPDDAIRIKSLEASTIRLGKGAISIAQSLLLSSPEVTMDDIFSTLWGITLTASTIWTGSVIGPLNKEMKKVELEERNSTERK